MKLWSLRFPTLLCFGLLAVKPSRANDHDEIFEESYRDKASQLDTYRRDDDHKPLTTEFGVVMNDTDNSLKAGIRGPTLLEDFHFREKTVHFDHERIPERVVHARGAGAHGIFTSYGDYSNLTSADFLSEAGLKTSTFVRFSTVLGSRGSADTVRDVRGFATRFFTRDGNFDLVGNDIPVFFVQDAIKFLDLIHAAKPEQDTEIPQAATAHDNFYDFVTLAPETLHTVLWALSPRGIPKSFRKVSGFGVHTFRLVTDSTKTRFVKFHWRPLQGLASLAWDEAQIIAGKDSDFHRRDLYDNIARGNGPEWELGLQIVEEKDEFKFDFDLLDATKIIPESKVPILWVGKMKLDRAPDNFFSEVEQTAYHLGHVVPGIDFSNDPLLQGRLFSYIDTQLNRFNGKNFLQVPINRPIVPVHNNHRDGYMQQAIFKGPAAYYPHTRPGGADPAGGKKMVDGRRVFVSTAERVDGYVIRARSPSFKDFYSQCQLFYNSLANWERHSLIHATAFELGKVKSTLIRARFVDHLSHIDDTYAKIVAERIGVDAPPKRGENSGKKTKGISFEEFPEPNVKGKKVGILVIEGADADFVKGIKKKLVDLGSVVDIIHPTKLGDIHLHDGSTISADQTLQTTSSVFYDGIVLPGGPKEHANAGKKLWTDAATNPTQPDREDPITFVRLTYNHAKPIVAIGSAVKFVQRVIEPRSIDVKSAKVEEKDGVVTGGAGVGAGEVLDVFEKVLRKGRFWERFRWDKDVKIEEGENPTVKVDAVVSGWGKTGTKAKGN
ncbi:hypothetical protein HDV00_004134 [Rhizophlyctis rosea]|nr:hypothetical protein HDV00_004134 [Rhizophlyctis rosea]